MANDVADDITQETMLNPEYEQREREYRHQGALQQSLDLAVRTETANAGYQDPDVMSARILSNADKFYKYLIQPLLEDD
jgi:hypothetical protein